MLRTVGQYMGKIRRMASEFQGQFQEAMREAEMADLKKHVDEMADAAKGFTDFDPLADVKKEVDSFARRPARHVHLARRLRRSRKRLARGRGASRARACCRLTPPFRIVR